ECTWTTDMTCSASGSSVRRMRASAWVDESIHVDPRPGGIYVLAAAISHAHLNLDEIRPQLRRLVPRRRRRLHWHAEDDRTRSQIFDTIAELRLEHVVVAFAVRSIPNSEHTKWSRPQRCQDLELFERTPKTLAIPDGHRVG